MKTSKKNKALDATAVTQTTTSITRTQKLHNGHTLLMIGGMSALVMNVFIAIPTFVTGNFIMVEPSLIISAIALGLGTIGDKLIGKEKPKGSVSEYDNGVFLPRRDFKKSPNGKMLLSTTPFTVKHVSPKNLAIENIQYEESDKTEEMFATHIMNEYAILQGKDIYFEQTIKETPLGMWQSAFYALADEERHMSTMVSREHVDTIHILDKAEV